MTTPRIRFDADDVIFEEGQTGEAAYMLVRGQVNLVKKGEAVGRSFVAENVTQPGTTFGLMPLIDNGPRMMSAVAGAPDTICEVITADALRKRIAASSPFVHNLMRVLTHRLRATTDRLCRDMVSTFDGAQGDPAEDQAFVHMDLKTYAPGEVLFREGEHSGHAYILESGCVELTLPGILGRASAELIDTPGMLFGFTPMIDGAPHSKTAVATLQAQCRIIDHTQFAGCLSDCDPVVLQTVKQLVKHLRKMSAQLAAGGVTVY